MTSTRERGWTKKETVGKKGPINLMKKKRQAGKARPRDKFDLTDRGRRIAGPHDKLVRIRDRAYLQRRGPKSKGPQYLLHYPRY